MLILMLMLSHQSSPGEFIIEYETKAGQILHSLTHSLTLSLSHTNSLSHSFIRAIVYLFSQQYTEEQ